MRFLLSAALDPLSNICTRLNGATNEAPTVTERRPIDAEALYFTERWPIAEKLVTRIRGIDGWLTFGHGWPLGIFVAPGCVKTSLMNMLIEYSEADVYIVGFIGDRGREVTEFIEELKYFSHSGKVVLVNFILWWNVAMRRRLPLPSPNIFAIRERTCCCSSIP